MILLIGVIEQEVAVNTNLNPGEITGGPMSIFNRTPVATEIKPVVEVVGVYSTLELAAKAREKHAQLFPGRKYIQKIAHLDDIPADAPPTQCISCHAIITKGMSYCMTCQQKAWEQARQADPEWEQEEQMLRVKAAR